MTLKNTLLFTSALFFASFSMQANDDVLMPVNVQPTIEFTSDLADTDPVKKDEKKEKEIFLWEVECNYGTAKGSAPTLEKAERMIKLMSKKDVNTYTIIQSGTIKV